MLVGREWPAAARRMGIAPALAIATMIAEVVIGVGVVLGDALRTGFLLSAAALLVAFSVLLAIQLRKDERPPCACFGGSSQRPIGARDLVRNVLLLVLVFVAIAS